MNPGIALFLIIWFCIMFIGSIAFIWFIFKDFDNYDSEKQIFTSCFSVALGVIDVVLICYIWQLIRIIYPVLEKLN